MRLQNADDTKFLAQFPNFGDFTISNCPYTVLQSSGVPGTNIWGNAKLIQGESSTHGDIRNPTGYSQPPEMQF